MSDVDPGAADAAHDADGVVGPDRVGEAVAHLQTAAREMIAAARAFLDVAEQGVEDPAAGDALLQVLGELARRVVPSSEADPDRPGGAGGVEHIPVD
mgnify:CR=1 FL=1